MNTDEKLQASKYLKIIPRGENFAIYHSLFGGICIVDKKLLEMFELFNSPKTLNEVMIEVKQYSVEHIKSFINLFKPRHFLVNPGFDEYDLVKQKIDHIKEYLQSGEQISIIQLVVTNLCNFRCEYCFADSIYSTEKRFESQSSKDNKIMDIKMADSAIKQVIRLLNKSGNKPLHIQFFGGEPLLNWKVIKFVLETFGDGSAYGVDIGYSIITNGSVVNEEMAEYFKKYNVPVIVSFDSPRGEHRLLKNGENSIHMIERSLSILKKYNNKIVFNSVLSEETFGYFDTDLVDFALKCGVSEIGVLLDLDPEFYINRRIEDIVDRLWNVYKYAKKHGVVVTGYWHMIFQQILVHEYFKYRGFKTCSGTGCQLSIEPSGGVFACKGSSGYFGHILEPAALLSSETYQKYATRAYQNPTDCRGCEIENFCAGFCLGPLEKKYNNIYVVEERTCEVYKELVRRLIMDLDENEVDTFTMIEKPKYEVVGA